jgi:hypothetical protein
MVFVKSEEGTIAAYLLLLDKTKDVFWFVMQVAEGLWVFGEQMILDGGGAE